MVAAASKVCSGKLERRSSEGGKGTSLLAAYGENVLWDYSAANIAAFRAAGLHGSMSLVPVGTVPQLQRMARACDRT